MERGKNIIVGVVSLAAVVGIFFALQRLVEPKYAGDTPLEGNFTAEYYQETEKHDVIMVGDCEVYENFDPLVLWKEYGITSYIRGNAQQLVWQSYYLLEDTLKYEKPKVVIYNVQSLTHGEPQREEYNRMCLDGMRWSKTKVKAIQASMCKGENMADYVLPLLRYHSRITELTNDDIKYYLKPRRITHNGYYMRIDTLPASESDVADPSWLLGTEEEKQAAENGDNEIIDPWADIDEEGNQGEDTSSEVSEIDGGDFPDEDGDTTEGEEDEIDDPWSDVEGAESADQEDRSGIVEPGTDTAQSSQGGDKKFSSYAMRYLDKLRLLCEQQGITLLLVKAPSLSPQWYDSQNQQVVEYAEKYGLSYINFYDLLDETGIDYETDSYDGGLHMNYSGAVKLSRYLGKYLSTEKNLQVGDYRNDAKLSKVYGKKLQFQEQMKRAQQKELDKYGEIRNY